MGFFDFMQEAIAIDLGTANTLIIHNDKVVVDEPSIVAKNVRTGDVIAIGKRAQQMHGKAHKDIETLRPLKDGVIADFQSSEQMIRGFIKMIPRKRTLFSPALKMVVCIPSGVTEVEKRAVIDSAEHAGAKDVWLIMEPMAAAIGSGMRVQEPSGNMIVDIGGGTTEVAVISLGGVVANKSVRVGGDELDNSIVQHIKKEYSVALGIRTSEELKIKLASAWVTEELYAEVRGRDLITGLPKTIVTSSSEIREAIAEPLSAIIDAVKMTLDVTPPELAADIMEKGIMLAGGGALLHGMPECLAHETGMPVCISPQPLHAVALGSGKSLESFDSLKGVLFSSSQV